MKLFAGLILFFAPLIFGKDFPTYLVKEVQGKALVFDRWAGAWTPIRQGVTLPEGELVQVLPGARVSIDFNQHQMQGLPTETIRANFNTPLCFRLEAGILRRMNLNAYFISSIPDIRNMPTAENTNGSSKLQRELKDAWRRLTAILSASSKSMKSFTLDKKLSSGGIELGVRSKQIRLIIPANDSVILSERLPIEMKVFWKKVSYPKAQYEIRVWREEELRPDPLVTTGLDSHVVKLFLEGTYFVQVSTHDGTYHSRAHRVHTGLDPDLAPPRVGDTQQEIPPVEQDIVLSFPPDGFSYHATDLPFDLTFQWESKRVKSDTYRLIVSDLSGKEIARKITGEFFGTLALKAAGKYRWRVEGTSIKSPHSIETAVSGEHLLTLVDRKPDYSQLLRSSGIAFLGTGL